MHSRSVFIYSLNFLLPYFHFPSFYNSYIQQIMSLRFPVISNQSSVIFIYTCSGLQMILAALKQLRISLIAPCSGLSSVRKCAKLKQISELSLNTSGLKIQGEASLSSMEAHWRTYTRKLEQDKLSSAWGQAKLEQLVIGQAKLKQPDTLSG